MYFVCRYDRFKNSEQEKTKASNVLTTVAASGKQNKSDDDSGSIGQTTGAANNAL